MEHNFLNLKTHILPLSVSNSWEEAKHEWSLDHVQILEADEVAEPETCPCGHFPIVELCWIRNRKNQKLTFVGNVCVKRFMGMPADTVADGFKRIMEDSDHALNAAGVEFAHEQGWISDWKSTFVSTLAVSANLVESRWLKGWKLTITYLTSCVSVEMKGDARWK